MTVSLLCKALLLRCLAGEGGLENKVTGCYVGDLLSWVMVRVREADAWVTVMGNVNAIAVAALNEAACVILCEGATLDADAKARADQNAIPVLCGEKSAFELAVAIERLLHP
jgi:predicted transcriptional regulator